MKSFNDMGRRYRRTKVKILVTIDGSFNPLFGIITDLSEGGARVTLDSRPSFLDAGSQCWLNYNDDFTPVILVWVDENDVGLIFDEPIKTGPLFQRLQMARNMPGSLVMRKAVGFGRRTKKRS